MTRIYIFSTFKSLKQIAFQFSMFSLLIGGFATNIQASTFTPETSNRVDVNFNFNWLYKLGDQPGAQATTFNDASWEKVVLPHSARLEPKVIGNGNYRGICWYRKSFTMESKYSGRKIFIEFEAAMGAANIWINGTAMPSHYGGYLPFTIDVTNLVKFDGVTKNVIAVKVDNKDDVNIPPGKAQANLDFVYFAGIYRNAWMHITDKTHITDAVYANKVAGGGIFVTYPSVSAAQATVQVKTNVINENSGSKNCFVKTTIVDNSNQVVATVTTAPQAIASNSDYTFTQTLTVVNPKLWHPNHPWLYTVYSAVNDGSVYVEQYKTRIGIRTIKMAKEKNGFWINGERLELLGCNRHQEYLYIGDALANSLQYRDVKKMKEAGLNFLRFSHYPMAPAFQDACDELGIMCVEPNPGWQYFGGTTFQNRAYQDVRDMVRRDRNRPSVIAWESNLNETYDMTKEFAQNCHNYTHAEYPGDQCFTAGNAFGTEIYDIAYGDCTGPKPYFTREWSDNYWESTSDVTGTRSQRKFGETDLMNSVLIKDPMFNGTWKLPDQSPDWCGVGDLTNKSMGSAMWAFFDANSGLLNDVAGWGAMDADRYPKFNYWWFQSQRDPAVKLSANINSGPMVKILSYWQQNSPMPLKIASNCEKIVLYLDNAVVETIYPSTAYPSVHHPLFTSQVKWKAGTLRAEAYINNTIVAKDSVSTPGAPDHIELSIDTMGVMPIADGSDLFLVYAKTCDKQGNIVHASTLPVTLTVSGEGSIVGDGDSRVGANPNKAEAGVAAFLIRTTPHAGNIHITGNNTGINPGTADIKTIPIGDINTGIDVVSNTTSERFDVFPNPTNSVLNIRLTNASSSREVIEIYDVLGKKQISKNLEIGQSILQFDITALKNGLYFIRYKTQTEKFIVGG